MLKKLLLGVVVGGTIIAGSVIGYKAATDDTFREALQKKYHQALSSSKDQIDSMAEQIALKRAKMTSNPKVNQEWTAKQWDSIRY